MTRVALRVLCFLLLLGALGADAHAQRAEGPSIAIRAVRGARSAREVHRGVLRSRARLAECQSPLCGEITLDVDIGAEGATRVRRMRLSSWDEQRQAGRCVTEVVERIDFGASDGETSARVIIGLDGCLPLGPGGGR